MQISPPKTNTQAGNTMGNIPSAVYNRIYGQPLPAQTGSSGANSTNAASSNNNLSSVVSQAQARPPIVMSPNAVAQEHLAKAPETDNSPVDILGSKKNATQEELLQQLLIQKQKPSASSSAGVAVDEPANDDVSQQISSKRSRKKKKNRNNGSTNISNNKPAVDDDGWQQVASQKGSKKSNIPKENKATVALNFNKWQETTKTRLPTNVTIGGLNGKAGTQDQQRLRDIRDNVAMSLDRFSTFSNGNIAFARVNIDGKQSNLEAFSGMDNIEGFVPPINLHNELFSTIKTKQNDRKADTEIKILDKIFRETTPDSKGTIQLVSQRPICPSCEHVIQQFCANRPNINIEISVGHPGPTTMNVDGDDVANIFAKKH